jgi:hypothetical protein
VKGLLLVLLRRLLGIALVVWVVSLVSFALYRTGVASASAATNAQSYPDRGDSQAHAVDSSGGSQRGLHPDRTRDGSG